VADRFATRLAAEVRNWVRDNLISAAQGERILAGYPSGAAWFSRPIVLFSLIGGALIAAGIALVVAHNWEGIHRWVKLGGVVVLMGIAHWSGLALRDRDHPKLGEGLLVIGGSLLIIGIALIGQIYNLSGHPSDPWLLWWVLLLPAAYVLPSMALGGLAYLGVAAWFGLASEDPATLLGEAVRVNGLFYPMAFAAGGMVFFGLGIVHGDGEYRRLRQMLEQLGLLALFGGLLTLGFSWRKGDATHAGAVSLTLLALLALALVAIAVAASRLPQDSLPNRLAFLAVLLVLLLYLFALKVAIGFGAPWQVFRNLAFLNWFLVFAACLAIILYGARWDRRSWINWGVVFIGVHAIARYVDLFGSMLQTSAVFFSAGVFVLLLGWGLERVRRRMVTQATARGEP
jgi:uncharacterized membrane protein